MSVPTPVPMLFIIGSPRSGTTMLERMLESHSQILGGPEPHLLTPLAHLGIWNNVDKAPYDHVLAAEAQRLFVSKLPNGEQDYWDACRAYSDTLYGRYLSTSNKTICLDKTPAYALVLPFIAKLYPNAKFIVLTRHPIAAFASYANSFFDGDYARAQAYNPLLNRYVPAIAAFLRQRDVAHIHVLYEDLVQDPQAWLTRICDFIGVPFEHGMIDYGGESREGLGDPVGVAQHDRPTTQSLDKWVTDLANDPQKRQFMQTIIAQLDPEDLRTLGYPPEGLWKPLEEVGERIAPPPRQKLNRYRLQRKAILTLRDQAQKGGLFQKALRKARLACDILLRE